jgi:hypothetical protein
MKKLWSKAGLCESFPEIEQGLSLVEKYDIMCVKIPDKWEDILKSNRELVKETFCQGRFLVNKEGQWSLQVCMLACKLANEHWTAQHKARIVAAQAAEKP